MTMTRIEELKAFLKKNGVTPDNLYVVYTGTDQLIGEMQSAQTLSEEPPTWIDLLNPKRVIRMQMQDRGGLVLHYLISNLDLMMEGSIEVRPTAFYAVVAQPDSTKLSIYEMYADFFNRKRQQEIADSGLVVPASAVESPFRKK